MRLHLVDATYELFRAHYAPRPPTLGAGGRNLSGVAGLVDQLLYLLREEGATHLGCATDHVIESFRNDMFPGYKSSFGMPRELLDQFPIADDAIAAACVRFAADPQVEQVVVCTPDKDMAQLVDDERVVLLDRRRRITYDEPAVLTKWGVPPSAIPDWLALVGDSSDGYPGLPGWGAKSAAAVLARYGSLEEIPAKASAWDVKSLRGGPVLAATLRERWDEVMIYRSLARLRTADDGVEIPQQDIDELRWRGTPRGEWQALCASLGLDQYASRPHRWLEEASSIGHRPH
jgi:5'-3' exonuclease